MVKSSASGADTPSASVPHAAEIVRLRRRLEPLPMMQTLSPPARPLEQHFAATLGFLRVLVKRQPISERAVIAQARECGRLAFDAGHSLALLLDLLAGVMDDTDRMLRTPRLASEVREVAAYAYIATEDRAITRRVG